MNKLRIFTIFISFCLLIFFMPAQNFIDAQTAAPRLGVWVTVFSSEKVLFNKNNADRLIETCMECGINDIYLQIYRSDKAYYNSDITDNTPYINRVTESKTDLIKYLIKKGRDNDIKLHAWINVLSIAQNNEANILKKYGRDVLTKDQHGRTSMQKGNKDNLDKYYIRENQLFLEPGDKRVRDYLKDIAAEIMRNYPGFSGIHLDYIRYPAAVPFIPGSKFTSHGLSYGYTKNNIDNFYKSTKIDMRKKSHTRNEFYKWDEWRRQNITKLIQEVSSTVKEISPGVQVSCTFVPSIERTYLTLFQDWTEWLREGYVDHIIGMNYTEDSEYLKIRSESVFIPGIAQKIHMGVGAYLLKDSPELFKTEMKTLKNMSPAGITIFSYDDIAASKDLQKFMALEFK